MICVFTEPGLIFSPMFSYFSPSGPGLLILVLVLFFLLIIIIIIRMCVVLTCIGMLHNWKPEVDIGGHLQSLSTLFLKPSL